jgi:phosphoketolase
MSAVDDVFTAVVSANPDLRPRVGNPDEMKSNRLLKTLELLKFRVTAPEEGVPEALHGAVITALNEEAIAGAALANKGGINLLHTYEAFGMKMHGILRQEIIFANHCEEAGRPQRWLSIPLCLTSHTWENGKNEQSHQDPSLAEALLGEPSHVARVVFPADFNTATAVMDQVYRTHGQIWTLVIPKADVPDLFTAEEAKRLVQDGGVSLAWAGHKTNEARIVLIALGAYQLVEVLHASRRLAERDIPHRVSYVLEPGRFRGPRSERERAHLARETVGTALFPGRLPLCMVTHTRPEPILGLLDPWLQNRTVRCLGYTGHGGTLNTPGMLFVNGCTWAHVVEESATLLNVAPETLLTEPERRALDGQARPHGVIIPEVGHD